MTSEGLEITVAVTTAPLWIVGKHVSGGEYGWQLCGVFSSPEKACAACSTDQHFLAPMRLDAIAPQETEVFPGIEYPRR